MKLIDILHEMEEEDGKKGLKRAEYDLTIQTDEIQPAIDALNNIENYGIYAQNLRDPETIKKVFGPSIPAQKAGAAWKHWDTSSPLEKEEKLADIQKREPQEFEAGMKEAEKGFEKWKEEGNDGSIEEYLYSLDGKVLPKMIVGRFGKNYFPIKTPDNLKKYAGRLEQGIHYMIDGDEIKFPQKESPYKTRAYLDKVIKTIMDNGGVNYRILKVEPTVSDKNIEPTRAPKEDTVSFKVTIDPTKLKGQRKEFNSLIQRLKNTYDKNFTYEGGVVNISKVKNQMAKIDLIKLFAPFAKKAEAPINEEKTLIKENYELFDKILSKYGYEDVNVGYNYRYEKKLDLGILVFEVQEKFSGQKRTNIFQYHFYFLPYIKERSRVFGLYKQRYHSTTDFIGLGLESIDFGEGLFRINTGDFESKLSKLLEDGEKRIEAIQEDDLKYVKLGKGYAPEDRMIKKVKGNMNEETLRMQKLAGIITEEEIQVILKEGVDKYLGKYRAPNGDLFNKYVNDENDVYIKDKKTGWNSIDLEIEGEVRSWEDIKADIKAANTRMSVKDFRASMGVYR